MHTQHRRHLLVHWDSSLEPIMNFNAYIMVFLHAGSWYELWHGVNAVTLIFSGLRNRITHTWFLSFPISFIMPFRKYN